MEVKRKVHVFQERTNTVVSSLNFQPMQQIVHKLQMSDTILPSFSYISPIAVDNLQSGPMDEVASLGLNRYSKAEQALAETFHRCRQETPSYQLQIETLQKATSILHARALAAAEDAEKLRCLLHNREIEPAKYKSLQQRRWMEERRRIASEDQTKMLQQNLSSLRQMKTQVYTQPLAPYSRLNANLSKFMETSGHRSARSRTRRRPPPKEREAHKYEHPRMYHRNGLLPLRLDPKQHLPFETDPKPTVRTLDAFKAISAPSTPSESTQLSTTCNKPQPIPHSRPSSAMSLGSATEMSMDIARHLDENGTAIIWKEQVRSKEDILANLVVSIPDYFGDLLAGLDTTPTRITLPPQETLQTPIIGPKLRPKLSKTTFRETLPPSRSEKPQASAPPPAPRLHKSPSNRRLSSLLNLPEALSSRIRLGDANANTTSRSSWRMSSPPSAFPSMTNLAMGSNAASAETNGTMQNNAPTRLVAVSFSGHPSTSVSALSQSSIPEPQPQTDGKALSRLRHRISVLRRN